MGRRSRNATEAPPPPPPALPVHVPAVQHPPGSLGWYEASLDEITERMRHMPHKDGAPYAALVRQKIIIGDKIADLREKEEAASAKHLSLVEWVYSLREQVARWPDMLLEIAVDEYLRRKSFELFDSRTGQVVPLAGSRPPVEDDDE